MVYIWCLLKILNRYLPSSNSLIYVLDPSLVLVLLPSLLQYTYYSLDILNHCLPPSNSLFYVLDPSLVLILLILPSLVLYNKEVDKIEEDFDIE